MPTKRVTLSTPHDSAGWALARLADAVRVYARNPSGVAYIALDQEMRTYQDAIQAARDENEALYSEIKTWNKGV